MEKRGFALILVLALAAALGSFGIAYADPPDGKGKPPWAQGSGGPPNPGPQQDPPSRHGLFGEITALDLGNDKFTLKTKTGDVVVNYLGAICHVPKPLGGSPGKPQPCPTSGTEESGLFKVGDFVAVQGASADPVFNAKRINWVPGRSLHGHCVGTVVGDVTGIGALVDMTVQCRLPGEATVSRPFDLTSQTKFRPKDTTATDINNGETVTVVYTRNRTTGALEAKHIVLHQEE